MRENTTKEKVLATIVAFLIIAIMVVYQSGKKNSNTLLQENKELKQNQKPATDLYNESNKPCAGC